jgi:prepilin-type N-terminal cleavage/methylation domain-containing protein
MRTRRAFTLVELLVVVAIIAILAAMLAPSLSRAQVWVRRVICRTRLKNLATGTITYASANLGEYLKCRQTSGGVQKCFNPKLGDSGVDGVDWIAQAAKVGLEGDALTCPERPEFPIWEPGFPQLVIGYQYFGGIPTWKNPSGSFPSRSPITISKSKDDWVFAADAMMKVDQIWGGGRPTAFGNMPQHRDADPWPAGGNQCYVDGSADWVDFSETIFIHSWNPGARAAYFYQRDLGDYNPPASAYGAYEIKSGS